MNKIFGQAKGIFNIITILNLIMGGLYFLLGLLFFLNPELSNILVSFFTGLLLIGNGIISIVSFVKNENLELYNYNLIYGIILVILGLIAMFTNKILSIFLGIYYIISGIQYGHYALLLKKFHESSWLFVLVTGLLFLILGITTFFTNRENVIVVSGICLMGYGLINIIDNILLRHRSEFFIA